MAARRPPDPPDEPPAPADLALEKRRLIEESLEKGKTLLRVDPRRPGVRVPDAFATDHALALNVSWRFAHTAMVVNGRGIAATLRFGGRAYRCVLPWSAVWGFAAPDSDSVHVWPTELPPELGGPPRDLFDAAEPPPVEPSPPRLSVVAAPAPPVAAVPPEAPAKNDAAETVAAELEAAPPAPAEPAAPRAPWLRLVR